MGRKRSLYYGVGINDSDYQTRTRNSEGKVTFCPYFLRWKKMLERCYASKQQKGYVGCYVIDEWLAFSVFKSWMEQQNWVGNELDKDLLGDGKCYSAETCCFLPKKINSFLVNSSVNGFTYRENRNKYQVQCSDPFGRHKTYIGYYDTEADARRAWLRVKNSYAEELSLLLVDNNLKMSLLNKYKETINE